jgi:hypothetical protein
MRYDDYLYLCTAVVHVVTDRIREPELTANPSRPNTWPRPEEALPLPEGVVSFLR